MGNITLFSQIIKKIDRSIFKKLVREKQTDKGNKGFDSWIHLVSMLFCHFAKSTSLRDISNGLRSATGNLNHVVFSESRPSQVSATKTSGETPFVKIELQKWLDSPFVEPNKPPQNTIQGDLFSNSKTILNFRKSLILALPKNLLG